MSEEVTVSSRQSSMLHASVGGATMVAGERVLMGLMGACLVMLLIQGLQRGVMIGEFADYDADDQPIRFALAVIGTVLAILICAVFASGYDLDDLWRLAKLAAQRIVEPVR